jgi:hypothetical protein
VPYYIVGTLTYASTTNRNAALTAAQGVSLGSAVPWAGGLYPAGINSSGSTVLTISYELTGSGTEARAINRALFNAISQTVRNAGHLALFRIDA